MDACGRVGGAGTTGDHANTGASGKLSISFGHHRRTAFLAADNEADRAVMQRVENGEIAFTRYAERHVRAVDAKLVDQNLAAGALVALGVGHVSSAALHRC